MAKLDTPMCLECERLWRDYQRATTEYLHLLAKLRAVAAPGNQQAETLLREVSAAEFQKKKTKDALDTHQIESGHR
jgi:hypothetical protein